ncbi:hypothetical protein MIND_00183000 [Mycena indigotica]|uniref:Uncharacterized protein n=1 Tax=Mycena indigotica TaxID=2126181 RepID=A0A8H6T6D8_9AGAR|nr:uncharacterized protein MIND_00183000 [Mycena indigotica]KAF7311730.1 hypothetical protein MIND_00183000 [Mycena indigotica]
MGRRSHEAGCEGFLPSSPRVRVSVSLLSFALLTPPSLLLQGTPPLRLPAILLSAPSAPPSQCALAPTDKRSFLDSPIPSELPSLSHLSTEQDRDEAILDVSAFSVEGFPDFKLDLECLSPPPSPPSPLLALTGGQGYGYLPSIPPSSRGSGSFSAERYPADSAPPRLSFGGEGFGTMPGGSWTVSRYVGRGTPIDRSRRSQWADGEQDESDVDEQGVLFQARATSMDSTFPPSNSNGGSQRSVSPLGYSDYVSSPADTNTTKKGKAHTFSPARSKRYGFINSTANGGRARSASARAQPYSEQGYAQARADLTAPLPESKKIKVPGLHSEPSAEWAEAMRAAIGVSTVQGTHRSAHASSPNHENYSAARLEDELEDVPLGSLTRRETQPTGNGHQQLHGLSFPWLDTSIQPLPSLRGASTDTGDVRPLSEGRAGAEPGAAKEGTEASASVYSCESSPREDTGPAPVVGTPADGVLPQRSVRTRRTGRGRAREWWRRVWSRWRGAVRRVRKRRAEDGKGKLSNGEEVALVRG